MKMQIRETLSSHFSPLQLCILFPLIVISIRCKLIDREAVNRSPGCGVHDLSRVCFGLNVDWMKHLPDTLPLRLLTLPAAHDSISVDSVIQARRLATQSSTFAEQMRAGLRLFDIRCGHFGHEFRIHHVDHYLNAKFDDILREAATFLRYHPTETILLRVKPEKWVQRFQKWASTDEDFETTFLRYWNEFRDIIYRPDSNFTGSITLGDARSKVVIVQYFDTKNETTTEYGIRWPSKGNETTKTVSNEWMIWHDRSLVTKWSQLQDNILRGNKTIAPALLMRYAKNQQFHFDNLDNNQSHSNHSIWATFLSGNGIAFRPYEIACGFGRKEEPSWKRKWSQAILGVLVGKKSKLPVSINAQQTIIDDGMNTMLLDLLKSNCRTTKYLSLSNIYYLGWIFMDFPSCALIRAIIDVNWNAMRAIEHQQLANATFRFLPKEFPLSSCDIMKDQRSL